MEHSTWSRNKGTNTTLGTVRVVGVARHHLIKVLSKAWMCIEFAFGIWCAEWHILSKRKDAFPDQAYVTVKCAGILRSLVGHCNAVQKINGTEETHDVNLEVKCSSKKSHRDLRALFLVCDAASLCNLSPTFRDVVVPKRRGPVAQ